jgi:hypothetical protein
MIKVFIFASVLMVTIFIENLSAAVLSSPNEGTVYKSGESIPVKVETGQNEQIELIGLYTLNSKNFKVLKSPPFEAIFKADDEYFGDDQVIATVKYMNGDITTLNKNVKIILKDGVELQALIYYKNEEAIIDTDSIKKLHGFHGMYSDGIERPLPNPVNPALLEYSSDDPSIVEVDNTGKMISSKLGKTFITIKSGEVSFKLPLKVFVAIVPPKNFKAVSTPIEIQLTWELSPNDPKWVTGYKIFRNESPDGFPDDLLTTVTKGTTSFTDVSAKPGKTYYYCVQAVASTIAKVSDITPWEIGRLLTP